MQEEKDPLKINKEELNKSFQEEKMKNDELLKENNYDKAISGYIELINKIRNSTKDKNDLSTDDKNEIVKEFLVPCYSNLCFIYLKKNDWNSVVNNSNLVLRYDKKNTKALYRKCVANINLFNFEEAQKGIEELKTLIPGNTELRALESMLEQKKTEDNLKQMKKYKNMMKSYYKMNEEEEYQKKSKLGKLIFDCKGELKKIFCCCNKRRTVRKSI